MWPAWEEQQPNIWLWLTPGKLSIQNSPLQQSKEEKHRAMYCVNCVTQITCQLTMTEEMCRYLVSLVHFSLRQERKSKIPSAYKFTTITQWISNLPGNTVDNVLQRKSNRLQLSGKDERLELFLSHCISDVHHMHWVGLRCAGQACGPGKPTLARKKKSLPWLRQVPNQVRRTAKATY